MHGPTGARQAPQAPATPSLEVTGTAISDGSFISTTGRIPPGIPRSPSGKLRAGPDTKGRLRPVDVHAAAMSEVNSDTGHLGKLWSLRVQSASPLAHQQASPSFTRQQQQGPGMLAAGLLPILLPPSPPGSSSNSRSPFHRTNSSRPSDREQPPSILSALGLSASRHSSRTSRYAGQEGGPTKRTASAPDSQSARLAQQDVMRRGCTGSPSSVERVGSAGQQPQLQDDRGARPDEAAVSHRPNRPPPLWMGQLGGPQDNLNLLASPTKPPPASRLLLGQQQEGLRAPGSPSKPPPLRAVGPLTDVTLPNGDAASYASSLSPNKVLHSPHPRAASAPLGQQRPDQLQSEAFHAMREDGNFQAPTIQHRLSSASKAHALQASQQHGGQALPKPPVGVNGPASEGNPEGSSTSFTRYNPCPPSVDPTSGAFRPPPGDVTTRIVVNDVCDPSRAGAVYGGSLVPRPPSQSAGPEYKPLAPVRTRRRSSRLNSPAGSAMQSSSPLFAANSPQTSQPLQGELQRDSPTPVCTDAASLLSRAQSLASACSNQTDVSSSPAPTPGSARPNSGRTRAVQYLIDAVRSKDSARFQDALEYLRLPNGSIAGLNERHNVTGRTPLHEAVMLNNKATVQRLIEAGAHPNIGHLSQGPPLLHAAAWGEADMVELLLGAGADVGACDVAGHTALHYACSGGHALAAQGLLQKGADISAQNEDGDSPMALAEHHPALQALLRSWSPTQTLPRSTTAQANNLDNSIHTSTIQHPGSSSSAKAGAPAAGNPQVDSPSTGNVYVPSPPQSSRQNSGRSGETRVMATPVAKGYKLQAQAQVPATGEQGQLQQQPQHNQQHSQSSQHSSKIDHQRSSPQHLHPHSHRLSSKHDPPHSSQRLQQQQQRRQQALTPQPPGFTSMSTRNRGKRPGPSRDMPMPSGDSPASLHVARLVAAEGASGSDGLSGSEGSPDLHGPPLRPHSQTNANRLYPSLFSNSRDTGHGSGSQSRSPLQSPLSNDVDDKGGPLPSPPKLELPRNVWRQLSKGAVLQDIIHAFEEEDEEVVRRFSAVWGDADANDEETDGDRDRFSPQQVLHAQPQSIMFGFPPTPSPSHPSMPITPPTPIPSANALSAWDAAAKNADSPAGARQTEQPATPKPRASAATAAAGSPAGQLAAPTSHPDVVATTSEGTRATDPGPMSPRAQLSAAIPRAPRFKFGVELAMTPSAPPMHPDDRAWEARLLSGHAVGDGQPGGAGGQTGARNKEGNAQLNAKRNGTPGPGECDEAGTVVDGVRGEAGGGQGVSARASQGEMFENSDGSAFGPTIPDVIARVAEEPRPSILTGGPAAGQEAATSSNSNAGASVSRRQQSRGEGVDEIGHGLHAEISLSGAAHKGVAAVHAPPKVNLTESGDIAPPLLSDNSPVSTPRETPSTSNGSPANRRRLLHSAAHVNNTTAGSGALAPNGPSQNVSPSTYANATSMPSSSNTHPQANGNNSDNDTSRALPYQASGVEEGSHRVSSEDGAGSAATNRVRSESGTGEAGGVSSGNEGCGSRRGRVHAQVGGGDAGRLPPRKGKGTGGHCMAAPRIAAAATAAAAQWAREGSGNGGALYASSGMPPLRISQAAQAMVAQVERALAAAALSRSGSGSGSAWRASSRGSGSNSSVGAGVAGNPGAARASHEALQLRAVAMFTRSMDVQTGSMQWTRGELLGEGSFGRVYAGLNQRTGELMAVKVLELLTKHKAGLQSTVMQQLQELQQELELYKNLQHLHVVTYIDHHFDQRCSTLYIFLEYVPGGSIASMLDRFGKFSEDLVRNYTRQLLLGLEYLHGSRVCHRDLKGGNVLVTRDGVVKLADFGASKAFQGDTITEGMKSIKGSAFWMAPEVIKGTGYNFKADVWSLGCTVIEMLTGKHPWPELENALTAMFQIAKTTTGPPRPINASQAALDFLDCCLRVDPHERPAAAQLLQHPWLAVS